MFKAIVLFLTKLAPKSFSVEIMKKGVWRLQKLKKYDWSRDGAHLTYK